MTDFNLSSSGKATRGFSLIELLMSIMILAIGLLSVAALFPAGIVQQQRAKDDVDGPAVAKAAMDMIRSRLSQEDFGAWTDFYTEDQVDNLIGNGISNEEAAYYLRDTDWPWQRPALVDSSTAPASLRGTVDVFNRLGYEGVCDMITDRDFDPQFFRYFQSRYFTGAGAPLPLGIPFSVDREWPETPPVRAEDIAGLAPPRVLFGQAERRWPPEDGSGRAAQYYWDFMLRRHGGRVYVAVFVYRAIKSGGGAATWAVEPIDQQHAVPFLKPLDLGERWAAGHGDGIGVGGQVMPLPGTTGDFDPTDTEQSWQYPAQYIVDNIGQVHRVTRGRVRPNQVFPDGQGVRLDSEIPAIRVDGRLFFEPGMSTVEIIPQTMSEVLPYQDTLSQWFETPGVLSGGFLVESQDSIVAENIDLIDRLWFVPRTVNINGQEWELIPAFVQVEQL
ncbi:MAG: prepilin-type N-terminal cleavage/methylation domain-containing protein [Phycisphaerales bacterium]|nr:prepilin-type N-terminal cleavage/methylation domain-containing protein [Phycisphaerales bacterium]